jgi:LPS-assembly lipoprotein
VEEDAAKAEALLQILSNDRGREILSLTGAGKVREYQLVQVLALPVARSRRQDR